MNIFFTLFISPKW